MMNSLSKYIVLLLIVLLAINNLQAQLSELDSKLKGKTKLKEVSQIVTDHIKAMPEGREQQKLQKHFSRWAYYQSIHLGSDGEFVNVSQKTIEAVENKKADATRTTSNGDWNFVGPSYSPKGIGRVDRIAFHPTDQDIYYIGTPAGGLWRTIDDGYSWQPISSFIPSIGISGIVIDHFNPNRIYVLTGSGDAGGFITDAGYLQESVGVLLSEDNGETWQQTGQLSAGNFNGFRLVQHPSNPLILFAATTLGVYKTDDGGDTWVLVNPHKCYDIEFKPGNPSTLYASGVSSMYYSYSAGELNTWNQSVCSPVLIPNGRVEIAVTSDSPNSIFLLAGPGIDSLTFNGLYRSNNSGQTFNQLQNTPNVMVTSDGSGSDPKEYCMGLTVSPTNDQLIIPVL